MSIITLTTDFGLGDWFAGAMKGVILGIQPRAAIVDITHEILAGDIRSGAFALAASFRFFPKQTIHVAVVDPGVGSGRSSIAVQTKDYFFVGPDNGLLSLALAEECVESMHRLENTKFLAASISNTFHGRDVFAPAAAYLSKGTSLSKMGRALTHYQKLSWPIPLLDKSGLRGEVIYIDRFGNAITNIGKEHLGTLDVAALKIAVAGNKTPFGFGQFYQEVAFGRPLGLIGSNGFLEIAINGGNAAKKLGLNVGDSVSIRPEVQSRG